MSDLKDFVCLTSHCKCNSKCDDCSECENEIDKWLLEHDKQIRADAIDELKKKIEKEEKWLLCCKVFDPNVTIAFKTLKRFAEQLKEQTNE